MKKIIVSDEIIKEGYNIIEGVYYPLKGFLRENDLLSVLAKMRLENGSVWSMPIVLDVDKETADEIGRESSVTIANPEGEDIFILENISIYPFDKKFHNEKLFGTSDENHPGVRKVLTLKDFLLGGDLKMLSSKKTARKDYFSPDETREIFKKNGWANVVAFQTRNPPHRSHEHLQKTALKNVDGLFLSPVIGPKKEGDFRDEHILRSYEILIEKYYPEKKVHLGTFHTFMRYAGPKEAVFHALVRRNFGCTHMIIGRDHAGVGDYYDSYAAHHIFDNFTSDELGITILKYENAHFCEGCQEVVFEGQCKHGEERKVQVSGTKLREKFQNKEEIHEGLMRKEVIEYLQWKENDLFIN